jgi:Domain of unknown function (DUF4105)
VNGPRTDPVETRRPWRTAFAALAVVGVVGAAGWSAIRPSNDREWAREQGRLAVASFEGNHVTIRNVRNFDWPVEGDPTERWTDRTYDLDEIETVWYVLTPFATDWRGPAHAFLSFGFADSQYVSISVEARREVGETYSIRGGLLKRFEITYIIGDERDLIGLRALRQHDDVYVYPIRATREAVRQLFEDMLRSANRLVERPEFYGSLRNNCTTRILRHVNALVEKPIRWQWRVLLPGYSDELAYERGLIDTELPLDSARVRYLVNDRVRAYIDSPDFAARIRDVGAAAGDPDRTPGDGQ